MYTQLQAHILTATVLTEFEWIKAQRSCMILIFPMCPVSHAFNVNTCGIISSIASYMPSVHPSPLQPYPRDLELQWMFRRLK